MGLTYICDSCHKRIPDDRMLTARVGYASVMFHLHCVPSIVQTLRELHPKIAEELAREPSLNRVPLRKRRA